MFSTFKQKLLLGVYIFILLSIPVGAYIAVQYQTTIKSSASEKKTTKLPVVTPKPATQSPLSPAQQLLNATQSNPNSQPTSSQPTSSATPADNTTLPTSYGPTLSLKINLEGRPTNDESTRLFVGIMEGSITTNPKFVLNFTVDVPASGEYSGLSLAGLTPGTQYTAILKGSAQLATSVTFTMSPATTNLNGGQTINMLSGDLNDDNVVNSADYDIVQKAFGSAPNSSNWNNNADLNKDGVINTFDLAIVNKNLNQVGTSGVWTSPIPKTASSSASLNSPPVGGPPNSNGYWLWLPK